MYEALTWRLPYHQKLSPQVYVAVGLDDERPVVPPDDELPNAPAGRRLELYKALMRVRLYDAGGGGGG
jgi:hypothetical protein